MQRMNDPQIGAFFKIHRWNENSLEQLRTELLSALSHDPDIGDDAEIDLHTEGSGNVVTTVRLTGAVASERERQRAAKVVLVNTHNEVAVENELAVTSG